MNITFSGTLEEFDAFVSRYRIPSQKSDGTKVPESTQIKINGQKIDLDTAPKSLKSVINKAIDKLDVAQKPESEFFIPKFAWDKNAEKSYKTLFFYETEDGRAMLSYCSCKVFTTKEKVLTIPYPLVSGYEPLKPMCPNKRSALRFYRQYLAEVHPFSKYTEKSTQERIKENVLQKHKATEESKKPEMKARTKELREIAIKMGVQSPTPH